MESLLTSTQILVLVGGGLAAIVISGGVAAWLGFKQPTRNFGQAVQLTTIILVVYATMVLSLARVELEATIGLFGAIVGYVLGSLRQRNGGG